MRHRNTDGIKNSLLELVDYIGEKTVRIEIEDVANRPITRIIAWISDGHCESRDIDFVEDDKNE